MSVFSPHLKGWVAGSQEPQAFLGPFSVSCLGVLGL